MTAAIRLFQCARLQVHPINPELDPYSDPVESWLISPDGVEVTIHGDPPPEGLITLNIDGLPLEGTYATPEQWEAHGDAIWIRWNAKLFESPQAQFLHRKASENSSGS